MEQKKIIIVAVLVLLVLAGAYTYLGASEDKDANETPAAESGSQADEETATSSYSVDKDSEDAESGNYAILEQIVDDYPQADFSMQQSDSFEWMNGSGNSSKKLTGKSIEAYGVESRLDLESFFEKAGYDQDPYNAADGISSGQAGFSDGKYACLYEYSADGENEEEASDALYNIKITCAENE